MDHNGAPCWSWHWIRNSSSAGLLRLARLPTCSWAPCRHLDVMCILYTSHHTLSMYLKHLKLFTDVYVYVYIYIICAYIWYISVNGNPKSENHCIAPQGQGQPRHMQTWFHEAAYKLTRKQVQVEEGISGISVSHKVLETGFWMFLWVNYNDFTATSLEIMVFTGKSSPNGPQDSG